MSELQVIELALERAAQRRRWAVALRALWRGLLVGASLWLVALAVFKLAPIPTVVLAGAGLLALACPLVVFLIAFWRKPGLAETARWVDVRQNLKERLSTALEVGQTDSADAWRELVIADAANHADEIDPRRLVPFHLTRAAHWTVLVLAVAAGLGFAPEYRSQKHLQREADAKVIKEAGKQVAELARRELQQRPPTLETTRQALESVSELGEKLQKVSLTRSEALRDLASASDRLKDQLKDLAKDPALKKMAEAARSGGDSQTGEGLRRQMENLQKQLGNQSGNPEAMDKLQKDLQKLQETAKNLANQTGEAAEAERQKLAAALSALAQQAAEAGIQLPQLDDAIAALAANQTDRFLQDLDSALTDLDKLRDLANKLQQLQAQIQKPGKDLAEQLKLGQADVAARTLRQLAKELTQPGLTPEQMAKILKEIAQAVPESREYSLEIEAMLKQACQQGEKGDNAGASRSLAAAADELEKLMEQMADAESLLASLADLDKASMCIGSCQGWNKVPGRRPGNPGGRNPGAGVGTWGEERGEWMESFDDGTGNIDRSALNVRDQEGRGLADRPPGDVSDRLSPTKVKGQFSPGGQMPSITLKGVSIRGSSGVQYEEAVTAAQTDAQSALSQEKVPRAYQGAVRDYFDDLKK